METTVCNYCQSPDSAVLYTLPDLMFERPDVMSTLVRCLNCGLVYQNPRPTQAEMADHYPEDYDCYSGNPVAKTTPWLLRLVYGYGVQKRTRTVTRYKRTGRLLDVGCATGHFLLGMKHLSGWELQGVEISPHAAELARAQNLDVFTGTLEEAHYPSENFDAVTLWDVFEHLHNPSAALNEAYRLMKPGGILVMRVPNADSWDAKIFKQFWAGFEPPRHIFVFNLQTLRQMVEKAGFRILDMNCNIGSYPTFLLSLRFWLTAKQVPRDRRRRILRLLEHPVMRLLTAPLFFIANIGLRGPLVILIARK